jgi:preprotein translocase subunit SecA
VTTVNVLITHLANKKKTVSYVSSQEEVHTIASSYYKQQYDEYLTTQEKTKSWDYEHMKIACNMTFRPDCTILQMSGTPSQNSYVCFANLKLEDLLID